MNNEIGRRDFMKLSAASIMTASVALNFGNTAFAATASENPKDVLKNFFESFSPTDHESWVNYFASSVYGYYRQFAQNAFNQAKRLGLLDINKAELLYAEKVNNVYAPKYYEFNQYYDSGTNYACYKTITDMETETGEYFGNGTNFSLVLMIREASGWKIGGICKCPRDLGSVPAGITVSRQSYGFVSYQSQPSYIKVKDENGTVKNVAFSTYLKNVTYNEIGNMGYYDEAIKANVMAIKMCGWWAHAAGYRSAEGCDIKYGDVAYKSSYQTKPAITNAINAVDGKKLVSSGGQLFFTSYFAGSSDTAGKNSGRLRQNGSNYLASTKSYPLQNQCRFKLCHIVVFSNHLNQFIASNEGQNHTCNGQHHIPGEGFDHSKNARFKTGWFGADLLGDAAHLGVHIIKQAGKIGHDCRCQQRLYPI